MKNPHAAALGKKGGKSKSPAKIEAARRYCGISAGRRIVGRSFFIKAGLVLGKKVKSKIFPHKSYNQKADEWALDIPL